MNEEIQKIEEQKEVSLDWLDNQFLFMLETYLLALPLKKVENCQMSNIKHMFTKH